MSYTLPSRNTRDPPEKVFLVTYSPGRQTVGEWTGRMEGFEFQLGRFSLLRATSQPDQNSRLCLILALSPLTGRGGSLLQGVAEQAASPLPITQMHLVSSSSFAALWEICDLIPEMLWLVCCTPSPFQLRLVSSWSPRKSQAVSSVKGHADNVFYINKSFLLE